MSISSNESLGFHARMTKLELKLKQSEDERLNLEKKFNELLRNRKTEESVRLREQYLHLLELDRSRCERNDTILRTLERVETRASSLTAKTDRLRLLRRCYESYLGRHYQDWNRSDVSYSSTLGSVSDINELSTSRPASPSPQSIASAVPHFSRTLRLTRRGSLVVPDTEISETSRLKSPSEMIDTNFTARRRLFGGLPHIKSASGSERFLSDITHSMQDTMENPKILINDDFQSSMLGLDEQNTSNDLLQVSFTDDSIGKCSPRDKDRLNNVLKSESIIDKVNTLNHPSSLISVNRKHDQHRLSRNFDINRSLRLNSRPLSKSLNRSISFNKTSSYSQKPETYFPSERRSTLITRPLAVNKTNVSAELELGSRRQSLPSAYMRSKSPLRVVDDIFKKYLINYDKRYLSDPISESKYGKYLYPPSTQEYEDYKNITISRSKSFLNPRIDDYKSAYHEHYSYLPQQDNLSSKYYNCYESSDHMFNRQSKYTSSDSERYAPQFSTRDWKDWNHYRDRYEYLSGVETNYAQNKIHSLDESHPKRFEQNTTTDQINSSSHNNHYISSKYLDSPSSIPFHKGQTKDTTLYENSLHPKPKSSIIQSGSEETFTSNHYYFDGDKEFFGKPEYDTFKAKENVRSSQTPKRVSFSNEFLYDDQSDPDVSLSTDEKPSPDEVKKCYESPSTIDFTSSIGKELLSPGFTEEALKEDSTLNECYGTNKNQEAKANFSNDNSIEESKHFREQRENENSTIKVIEDMTKFENNESSLNANRESNLPLLYNLSDENPDDIKYENDNVDNNEKSSVLENAKSYLKRRSSLFPSDDVQKILEACDEHKPSFASTDEISNNEVVGSYFADPEIKNDENLKQEMLEEKLPLLTETKQENVDIISKEEQPQGDEISEVKEIIENDEKELQDQSSISDNVQAHESPTIQPDSDNSADNLGNMLDGTSNVIINSDVFQEEKVPAVESQLNLNEVEQSTLPSEVENQLMQQSAEPYLNDADKYEQISNQQVFDSQEQPSKYIENKIQQQSDLSEYQTIGYNQQQPVYEDTPFEQNTIPEDYTAQEYVDKNVYQDNALEYGTDYGNAQYDDTQANYDQYKPQPAETYSGDDYVQHDVPGYNQPQVYDTNGYNQENIPQDYQQSDTYPSDYQQPVEYGDDNYEQQSVQGLEQPVSEQYQADSYIEQPQYEQGYEEGTQDEYAAGQYEAEAQHQDYPPVQYEEEYPQEYVQQPVQYEEGYQDPIQDMQNDPEQYDTNYQKDPQYQYDQQEGNFDQENIPEQYDQYQQNLPQQYEQYDQQQSEQYDQPTNEQYDQYNQPTAEQYDQYEKQEGQYDQYEQQQPVQYNDEFQGNPDQYDNYDYGYDQQPGTQQDYRDDRVPYSEPPQVYSDDVAAAYGEVQQAYGEDQETYAEGQDTYREQLQPYSATEYLPQNLDSVRLEDVPSHAGYISEDQPDVDQPQSQPDPMYQSEDGPEVLSAPVDPGISNAESEAKAVPDLSRVLESDSESAPVSQPAVSQDDGSDFDFSSGKNN